MSHVHLQVPWKWDGIIDRRRTFLPPTSQSWLRLDTSTVHAVPVPVPVYNSFVSCYLHYKHYTCTHSIAWLVRNEGAGQLERVSLHRFFPFTTVRLCPIRKVPWIMFDSRLSVVLVSGSDKGLLG